MAAKYIFLDIDGVLNFDLTIAARGMFGLDPICLSRLSRIVAGTGAQIVISSSWRIASSLDEIRDAMQLSGFAFPDSIVDATPKWSLRGTLIHGAYPNRGSEIAAWLDDNGVLADDCVILDDDLDMEPLAHRHVEILQGFYSGGLQDKHVEQALQLLGRS